GLETLGPEYYRGLAADYRARRDLLCGALGAAGFRCTPPEGAYYILADFSAISDLPDDAFARWLTCKAGVAPVPGSSFFSRPERGGGDRLLCCGRVAVQSQPGHPAEPAAERPAPKPQAALRLGIGAVLRPRPGDDRGEQRGERRHAERREQRGIGQRRGLEEMEPNRGRRRAEGGVAEAAQGALEARRPLPVEEGQLLASPLQRRLERFHEVLPFVARSEEATHPPDHVPERKQQH